MRLEIKPMLKKILLYFLMISCGVPLVANDSLIRNLPYFVSLNTTDGLVFQTNDFVSGENKIPAYTSFALKFGVSSKGDNWKDHAYGMPYMGIGIYTANFHRSKDLGRPFSVFLFQGAQLFQFTPKLSMNYEFNLGSSFNWKHYDPFDNPENTAMGSSVNVHVGGNLYLKWKLSHRMDLHTGAGITHFSNGASSLPNKGLNMAAAFFELTYHFNQPEQTPLALSSYHPAPRFRKYRAHDVSFLISTKEAKVDTTDTGLATSFVNRKFKVLGLNYSYMFCNNYRYKWGPSLELSYDESSGIKAWMQQLPETGKYYERIKLGKVEDRFSAGLSIKGEMLMPAYSLFCNLGYNVLHGNKSDKRLYQIAGVKIHLSDHIFGTFGIRATSFGKAQYLYWTLGYSFKQYSGK